jgi:hypothetical protein
MARVRSGQLAFRAGREPHLLDVGDDRVLAYVRQHPRGGRVLALAVFSDDPIRLSRARATPDFEAAGRPLLAAPGVELGDEHITLPAWSYAWLAAD